MHGVGKKAEGMSPNLYTIAAEMYVLHLGVHGAHIAELSHQSAGQDYHGTEVEMPCCRWDGEIEPIAMTHDRILEGENEELWATLTLWMSLTERA